MIKVKVTKNINRSTGLISLTIGQIVAICIGITVGLITFALLYDYVVFDALMWIIFFEMSIIIGLGAIRLYDMNMFQLLVKMLKGPDKRPYSNKKGVFDDEFDIF